MNGFQFFSLLKRVKEDGASWGTDLGNYMSFTVWESKDDFNVWRSGSAFKEAHGGGGLTGFIGLLTTALFILDGGPKPAFYDGLLPVVNKDRNVLSNLKSENGWRKVEADGINEIDPEIFVVQNRFNVVKGQETNFEKRWEIRESKLNEFNGFVRFYLQRRDATKADDNCNYISTSIWKDKESFLNWKNTPKDIHNNNQEQSKGGELIGRPELAYYQGKLTLLAPQM